MNAKDVIYGTPLDNVYRFYDTATKAKEADLANLLRKHGGRQGRIRRRWQLNQLPPPLQWTIKTESSIELFWIASVEPLSSEFFFKFLMTILRYMFDRIRPKVLQTVWLLFNGIGSNVCILLYRYFKSS